MPRGGRYRPVSVGMWGSPEFIRLSAHARLTLLALRTRSSSDIAGIFRYFAEALTLETGLTGVELEAALAKLEAKPTRAASFIVRDHADGIIWVRHQLGDDPAREKDPDITNEWHRKGIMTILGGLPKRS
jgi:hypothetical protein